MESSKLELKDLVEIRFNRLVKPKFLQNNLPLFGSYNKFSNLQMLNDKLESSSLLPYNITSASSPAIQNLTYVLGNSAKLIGDPLSGLFIFKNRGTTIINVKDLVIKLLTKSPVHNTSVNERLLIANHNTFSFENFFSQKVEIPSDEKAIYEIEVTIKYSTETYNQTYLQKLDKSFVKEKANDYYIDSSGSVVKTSIKKFKYEAKEPFKVAENIVFYNFKKVICELSISTEKKTSLFINKVALEGKSKALAVNLTDSEVYSQLFEMNYEEVAMKPILSFQLHWSSTFDTKIKVQEIRLKNSVFNPFFTTMLSSEVEELKENEISWITFKIRNLLAGNFLNRNARNCSQLPKIKRRRS